MRHWLEFGFGPASAKGDEPLIQRIAAASLDQNLPVKKLLVQLVQSPSFRSLVREAP